MNKQQVVDQPLLGVAPEEQRLAIQMVDKGDGQGRKQQRGKMRRIDAAETDNEKPRKTAWTLDFVLIGVAYHKSREDEEQVNPEANPRRSRKPKV